MPDTIKFPPQSAVPTGTLPTFTGHGSSLKQPDLIPLFWGPNWPGTGGVTMQTINAALYKMASGPYFDGLKQYGFEGPINIKSAILDSSSPSIVLPVPAPGVSQSVIMADAVDTILGQYFDDGGPNSLDDDHNVVVMVLLDPSIPIAVDTNAAGKQISILGENGEVEYSEPIFDDNIRYTMAWINTSGNDLATVMRTISHELVEALSDPFGSGWEWDSPPNPTLSQVADVCNQPGMSNGADVVAYWSEHDKACIIPTPGDRRVSMYHTLDVHQGTDAPIRDAIVHMPIICGGDQTFQFIETTFKSQITCHLNIQGYERPVISWKINGNLVNPWGGQVDVDAFWDEPKSNSLFPDPAKATTANLVTWSLFNENGLSISCGPNEGNVSLTIFATVTEAFDTDNVGKTARTALIEVDVVNQLIRWVGNHDQVVKQCNKNEHLHDGVAKVFKHYSPDDPGELVGIVENALREQGSSRAEGLRSAASRIQNQYPEMAQALNAMAARSAS
jgi:hypothetical protein